jgi:hypothetical protein
MRLILTCLALAATAFAESPPAIMKAILAHEYGGSEEQAGSLFAPQARCVCYG